jgi:hypothetical protein
MRLTNQDSWGQLSYFSARWDEIGWIALDRAAILLPDGGWLKKGLVTMGAGK